MGKVKLINYYNVIPKEFKGGKISNPNYKLHELNLPILGVIVGSTGSGKTATLLNIINVVSSFDVIRICTQNKDEPLYNWLESVMKKNKFDFEIVEGIENLPDLDKFDKSDNNLIVMDDMCLESKKNQKPIEMFYCRARKLGCSCLYLSQSWYQTPLFIRQNATHIFIKRFGGNRDVQEILKQYSLGVDKKKLLEIYKFCLSGNTPEEEFNNFMLIDVKDGKHKFRKNFEKLNI